MPTLGPERVHKRPSFRGSRAAPRARRAASDRMVSMHEEFYPEPVMVTLRRSLLLIAWGVTAGCGGNSYATAAGATAVTVAATGVHRALTRDCWGRCSPGYACNEQSGLCEPGECDPACPAGYSCRVTPTSSQCRPDPAPLFNSTTGQVSVPGGATPAVLPSDPLAPGRAAPSLTPDRATSGQVQIQRGNPGPHAAQNTRTEPKSALSGATTPNVAGAADPPCPSPPAPSSRHASPAEPRSSSTSSPKSEH